MRFTEAKTVERFNRTLAECLFGHQYPLEILLSSAQRSKKSVARLSAVVAALNSEVPWLSGKEPADAIKKKAVSVTSLTTYNTR